MKMVRLYLKIIHEQEQKKEIVMKIMDFFRDNPSPADKDIHEFADREKMNPHEFEEHVYKILGNFLGYGRSKDFKGTYDPKQIEMGIKVEMEHTSCPLIAERITKDHLAESPDYYTRLLKMEKEFDK